MQTTPRIRIGSNGGDSRAISGAGVGALTEINRPRATSEYMRGNGGGASSPFFFNWNPALRDNRDDVRQGYVQAAARAIDGIQNSGWLSGAVEQSIASTIGVGLNLAAKPNADGLKWTKDEADAWSRTVERRWQAWSDNPYECDAAGKHTIGQQTASVMESYYSHGEAVALLPKINRPESLSRLKVHLLPAHKLTQNADGFRKFQGVTMDQWGFPLSYELWLRMMQPYDELVEIPAHDRAGRPQVLHIFKGKPGQIRGITPMVAALRIIKQLDQLSDANLTSELLRAIFAATIKSDAPTDDILRALQDPDEQGVAGGSMGDLLGAKAGWYENTKIDLGRAGRIAHLFPGEELNFHGSQNHATSYEAFAKFLLREIARCLGLTFETLTGDYSGATYSSVRMAGSEIWPIILARRINIAARFCQSVYEQWLLEEIETERIAFPQGTLGFLANREAAITASWRGPAKPQADDLKTQKAHEGYKRMGVLTDERICADLGEDYEETYEARAREMALRKKLGLPEGDTLQTAQNEALVNSLIAS